MLLKRSKLIENAKNKKIQDNKTIKTLSLIITYLQLLNILNRDKKDMRGQEWKSGMSATNYLWNGQKD